MLRRAVAIGIVLCSACGGQVQPLERGEAGAEQAGGAGGGPAQTEPAGPGGKDAALPETGVDEPEGADGTSGPLCPSVQPTPGASCQGSEVCDYGPDVTMRCGTGGTWELTPTPGCPTDKLPVDATPCAQGSYYCHYITPGDSCVADAKCSAGIGWIVPGGCSNFDPATCVQGAECMFEALEACVVHCERACLCDFNTSKLACQNISCP
jgi:hypothetical protein